MTKDDRQNTTLTHQTEVISFVPQEIAEELANQGLKEIRETNTVPFDPIGDATKLQAVVDIASRKLTELANISISEFLEQQSKQEALLSSEEEEPTPITLEDEPPSLRTRIAAEYGLAKSIQIYARVMESAMKQRRLLSGQLYGSRMQHNAQVGHMRSTRSIQLSGKNLIEELGKQATSLRLDEELELVNNGIPRQHLAMLSANPEEVASGRFAPVEDMAEDEGIGMLASDLD